MKKLKINLLNLKDDFFTQAEICRDKIILLNIILKKTLWRGMHSFFLLAPKIYIFNKRK
jgi:hypothetical protein